MLLAALVLSLSTVAPSPAPALQPHPEARQAECLRQCAGAPKDATGQKLMACLKTCEPPATDGGTPAP